QKQAKPAPAKASPAATTAIGGKSEIADLKEQAKRQRELDQVTREIDKTEAAIEKLEATMAEPGFFDQDQATVQAKTSELSALQNKLADLYEQWEQLESR